MKRGTDQDDVRVELMGLRFAQNATEHQVRRAVAVALMKHIANLVDEEGMKAPDAVRQSILRYRKLIQRDQSQETTLDQVDFLLEAQRDLIHRNEGDQILLHLAKDLYDKDLFEEEVITQWWNDDRSESTEELKRIKQSSKQFLDWLANADEESESESEDE
jgi:translation initiation factor eIF-2B subunit epsilon